jgi:hypothetical protein
MALLCRSEKRQAGTHSQKQGMNQIVHLQQTFGMTMEENAQTKIAMFFQTLSFCR